MRYAVGVDIGGSSTKLGIVDDGGHIVARSRVVPPASAGPAAVAEMYLRGDPGDAESAQ